MIGNICLACLIGYVALIGLYCGVPALVNLLSRSGAFGASKAPLPLSTVLRDPLSFTDSDIYMITGSEYAPIKVVLVMGNDEFALYGDDAGDHLLAHTDGEMPVWRVPKGERL